MYSENEIATLESVADKFFSNDFMSRASVIKCIYVYEYVCVYVYGWKIREREREGLASR